ncbi:hypothetical protein Hanom_Chr01g00040231 [Helianthus anomalus]
MGISNSSWVSLPFFVCSYVGLVDWSLTSNFHGLFRSGVRHTNVLLRGAVFRIFSINYFTYGVSLCALSLWSFYFASVCAFGLLAYVRYIIFAFPSLFRLHRLNGLLLVFILLWAVSTYIFNVAFSYLHSDLEKDMEIWEMVGLWHYPIPGFFIPAQFCLGVLVTLGNLVNNSVFVYISDEEDRPASNGDASQEGDTLLDLFTCRFDAKAIVNIYFYMCLKK